MNGTSYSQRSAGNATGGGFGRQTHRSTASRLNGEGSGFASGMLSVANGTGGLGQNPASLKGKLANLEETTKAVSDELSMHKKEMQILKSEKDTLMQVLNVKNDDLSSTLTNELKRLEDEMQRHFTHQKAETQRLQTQLNTLKSQKTALSHSLNNLENRISDLEVNVGNSNRF